MKSTDWTLDFTAEAEADLSQIEDHLCRAYEEFGESPIDAAQHAERRVEEIIVTAERLVSAPFRGAAHDDLMPSLRHLAIGRAVFWFVADPQQRQVRIQAIFFGGQDHQRHMLVRLFRKGRT